MKELVIKRIILLLVFTTNILFANAQAYEITCESVKDGFWRSHLKDAVKFSDKKFLLLDIICRRDYSCILGFILMDYGNSKIHYWVDEGKTGTMKIYLSNGEILTTTQAKSGSNSFWTNMGAQTIVSSKTNTTTNNGGYVMQQLRKYNITKIVLDGKEYATPNFRSAATIDAMCKTLISKTGDQGQYGSGTTSSSTTNSQSTAPASNVPVSASISNVTVAHNQTVKGENGMTLNMKLNVNGLKGKKIEVTAYFYDQNGVALNDLNQKYWTVDKKVCSLVESTPTYDRSTWDSYKISIPYRELHISGVGNKNVKYKIIVWNKAVSPSKELYSTTMMTTSFYNDPSFLKANGSTSNSSVSFTASGGKRKISVETSDGTYEVWGVPSWCKVENKTSTSFDLVSTANTTIEKRTDYLKVKAAGKELRIDVSQDKVSGPMPVIKNVWVEHNKMSGLQKGMKIHVNFQTLYARGMQGQLNAYFFLQNGNKLIDYNGYYRAVDGQVSTYTNFVPSYDDTVFNDAVLFIPYTELHLRGTFDCKFNVEVHIGGKTASSEYINFRVTL